MQGPQLLPVLLRGSSCALQGSCEAVGPLHVQLHVALLREAHDAVLALVGPLPGVLLHVHLQGALLVEGLLTEGAVERPLPCVDAAVSLQLAWLGKRLVAGITFEHSGLLRAQGRAGLVRQHVLLEVRGALEGLPADAAAVDALLAVRLLAVVHEQGGGGEGAVALQALVRQAFLLGLAARGQGGHVSHLEESGL